MKKILIKLGMILTAACLVCTAGMLASCGGNTETGGEKARYTVTVLDPAGEPVQGVKVKWGDGKTEYPTHEEGSAYADLASGEYEISLVGLSSIYKYTPVTATASDRDKTVTLEWNPEDGKLVYTVKVVYPDGTPVKGAHVELCSIQEDGTPGNCTDFPVPTNGKGEAYSMAPETEGFDNALRGLTAGTYKAKILGGIPAGYDYEQDADEYYTGSTATADNTTLTITLKKSA